MTATKPSPPMLGVLRLMAESGEPIRFRSLGARWFGWYCGNRPVRTVTVLALKDRGLVAPIDGRLRLTDDGRAAIGGRP